MCSRIFGLKPDDDVDAIFNLDMDTHLSVQYENRPVASSANEFRSTIERPMNANSIRPQNSDSGLGTENTLQDNGGVSNAPSLILELPDREQLQEHHGNLDSAIGTESQETDQLSPSSFNYTANENGESQVSYFSFTMNQSSSYFAPSQNEMFSQDYQNFQFHSMDANPCPVQHSDHSTNFDTQRQSTNDTSLSNLSFYSLMKRSLMRQNFQPPCSSTQLDVTTPCVTPGYAIEDETFSQFFNNRSFSTSGPSCSDFDTRNLSLEIASPVYFPGSDGHPYREDEQSDLTPPANMETARSILDPFQSQNNTRDECPSNQHQNGATASNLPKSILDLYEQIKSSGLSDWSFVYALSAQTCQEFLPMNYNITLKTSLLLSIASIDTRSDVTPIPIVAFGRDSSSANIIMNYIGNFAQRFLAPTDLTFNVMVNSEKIVEIGPVFLAKNGVCYLGDWSGLSKKVSDEIKIIIDSGRYFLNETSENFQLGSALWTYWSSMNSKKDFSKAAVFMKYFGIPIMTDWNESDDIIEFLLVEARDGKIDTFDDVLNIRNDDMKNYLNIVRKINVRKTEEAEQLLKAYSEAIQKDREGLLSARSFQIIQQMAESFAKLSLRKDVLVCDVVSAISIAEKTFHAMTEIPRAPLLLPTHDIEMVDQYIQTFHKWLFNYVGI